MGTSSKDWFALAVPIALVSLSGCGTSAVKELSQSTYSVSAQYGSMNGSWGRAQSDAIAKAKEFCAAKRETFSLNNEQRAGVFGFSPQSSTITFSCGPDVAALVQSATSECKEQLQTPELDPVRQKVELFRPSFDSPVPFAIATNDSFPTQEERKVIAKWATLREECVKRSNSAFSMPPSATALQVTQIQQDRAFGIAASARVGDLTVSLYQQKLTYGEFAKKRYEITRDAAEAERQFRQSAQLGDQQQRMQAQQLVQQQYQSNVAAWSTFMQGVNARQPLTVHLDGAVRLQTNCQSTVMGNAVDTNCR
jgi:hypothetical protein